MTYGEPTLDLEFGSNWYYYHWMDRNRLVVPIPINQVMWIDALFQLRKGAKKMRVHYEAHYGHREEKTYDISRQYQGIYANRRFYGSHIYSAIRGALDVRGPIEMVHQYDETYTARKRLKLFKYEFVRNLYASVGVEVNHEEL